MNTTRLHQCEGKMRLCERQMHAVVVNPDGRFPSSVMQVKIRLIANKWTLERALFCFFREIKIHEIK